MMHFVQWKSFFWCLIVLNAVFVCSGSLFDSFQRSACNIGNFFTRTECCMDPWIQPILQIDTLKEKLEENVFGQHIAIDIVLNAMRAHVSTPQPKKALVLSFNGWTGVGKNYIATFLANALYKYGMNSKYVHLMVSSLHFPIEEKADMYKLNLIDWIRGNASSCGRQLFIFDEMDLMHPKLIDSIKPFIDFYDDIQGVDFRKNIFLFLSNMGGNEIARIAYKFWNEGKKREDIKYQDLEHLVEQNAFNEHGGFQYSTLIERHLIDFFVPFLPMEKSHVKKCVEKELTQLGHEMDSDSTEEIVNSLTYFPENAKIYSKSGCKKIDKKVRMYLSGDLN